MKRVFSGLELMMLCAGMLTLAFKVQPVQAAAITVPDDYSTIQDAINHANSGDTIYVRDGIYQEHIDVNKTVTLIGESNQNTIIEARGSFGVDISASNTIFENFRVLPLNSTDRMEIPTLVSIDGGTTPCSNCSVRNCVIVFPTDLGADSAAIEVRNSANNTVTGNLITIADKSDYGIAVILGSSGNLIDNNTITGGWISMTMLFADNNTVSNNYIADAAPDFEFGAMYLGVTSGDTIRGNTFVNNTVAINPDVEVHDCLIYNNNFINNTKQALVGDPVIDAVIRIAWDDGYPSGGNYWSDYNGTDSFNGAYQNVTGSDGIGDTPYVINASNIDHYPLMKPWVQIPLAGDVSGDGRVNLADLILVALAYHSSPGDPNWNENADLNHDGHITLTDVVTVGGHYGQYNP